MPDHNQQTPTFRLPPGVTPEQAKAAVAALAGDATPRPIVPESQRITEAATALAALAYAEGRRASGYLCALAEDHAKVRDADLRRILGRHHGPADRRAYTHAYETELIRLTRE